VDEVADVVFGVLELGRPEQRVERADLDADPAVHAQREVDGEPVEHVAGARTAALGRGQRLLVRIDVNTPVRALTGAKHAHRAVLLDQGDNSACAGRQVGLNLWVLLRL
jgi:hypothetical protein